MKRTSFVTSIFGTALLLIPLAGFAQDDRAPLSEVWLVMPKKGMVTQFEQAAKTHIAFRRDAGESRNWEAYSASIGNNPMLYQFRSGGLHYADIDTYIAEDRAMGLDANWFANVDQYVDHYHHFLEKADYENSHWPPDMEQHPYYGVTTWTLKIGAGPGPEQARKELSRIAMEEGWSDMGYNWLWLERTGGTPTLMIVSEYDSFAAMEPPEKSFFEFVTEKLGSAEAAGKLFDQFTAGLQDSSYTIWAHRPDLSSAETAGSDDD